MINGRDVADLVSAMDILFRPGQLPEAHMRLMPDAKISGNGIVYIHQEGMTPMQFLETIDPKVLEHEALLRQEWGSGSIVTLMLDILKEKAGDIQS